jgi:hypothetical protein
MPLRFDATLKGLLEEGPGDWPVLAGLPRSKVEVIDADVSTVTGAADKVLRVRGAPDWIMHIDFQTGDDTTLPRRTNLYNALLEDRHDLLVGSVLVLLRPQADLANLTGVYQRQFRGEEPHLTFRYQVLRIWQLSVERLLASGPGTLPLAPVSAVREGELPGVIERIKERLSGKSLRRQATRLWTATYVLLGLRYSKSLADQLLGEVLTMEDSVTYQGILAKEARKMLLLQGRSRFGEPPAEATETLNAIEEVPKLEELGVRLLRAASWQELLDLPAPRPPRRRQKQAP